MRRVAEEFYRRFAALTQTIEVADRSGRRYALCEGIEQCGQLLLRQSTAGAKLFFLGNGANAGISSHMAADFSKNAGIPALTFSDASLLTALGNDCGFDSIFAKPLERFATEGDVVVALSSSGASPNVLKAAAVAVARRCKIVTLSGFKKDNPLRTLGDINFYVPHGGYALVEVLHHSICHCLLEAIMAGQSGKTKE